MASIVGAYGLAFATHDGGKHWQPWSDRIPNPQGRHLYTIHTSGNTLFVAGEQGALFRSADAGSSFVSVKTPYQGTYFGAIGGANGELVVFGLRGNVYWSGDAGERWQKVDSESPTSLTGGVRLADGTLVLVDQSGQALQSRDGGRTFRRAVSPHVPTPTPGERHHASRRWHADRPVSARARRSERRRQLAKPARRPIGEPTNVPSATCHEQAVVADLEHFDRYSGSVAERLLFNNRLVVVIVCLLLTAVLGMQATKLTLNAGFEKMVPTGHPFIVNYFANRSELAGLGNTLYVAVENTKGDIFDAAYLEALRKLNDEIFLLPGVDRSYMKSLWTPSTRWLGATEEGLEGGPVIPDDYDGSMASLQATARQRRALGPGRSIGRGQLSIEHHRRAAARHGLERQAARVRRVFARARAAARQVRLGCGQGPHHRLRQGRRRPDRRHAAGAAVPRARDRDLCRRVVLVHALHTQHAAAGRVLAGRGGVAARAVAARWATSSIRIRSSCRSSCSPSA